MDRGYIDFAYLHRLTQAAAFFVVRGRADFRSRRLTSHPVDKTAGLICDQAIARLYKCRRQVELFFKWIKQHLRIQRFFGNTENTIKTQVWIAVSIYVLVAIMKKRPDIDASLYTILQVLSVTVFEKTPLLQMLSEAEPTDESHPTHNQLNLFDY